MPHFLVTMCATLRTPTTSGLRSMTAWYVIYKVGILMWVATLLIHFCYLALGFSCIYVKSWVYLSYFTGLSYLDLLKAIQHRIRCSL